MQRLGSTLGKLSISPRILVALFVTLSTLMVGSAVVELQQSRRELRDLMEQQAHTLLESLLVASNNALNANDYLEETIRQRLLDNADMIRRLYDQGRVSNDFLVDFGISHELHRIRIVRPDGEWIYSNHERVAGHDSLQPPRPDLSPIYEGRTDTLEIGMRSARYESGVRYGVAVAARDRSAIVVNLNADELFAFRQQTGFGPLLRFLSLNPGIVYVALQDTFDVIAAAGRAELIAPFEFDDFLYGIWNDTDLRMHERILPSDSVQILEVAHPFFYQAEQIGVIRLGLSLEPLTTINKRAFRRLSLITLVILAVGFIVLIVIVGRQNEDLLARQYQAVETFSNQVIAHVGDGILVYDEKEEVVLLNLAAQEMLNAAEADVIGKPIGHLLSSDACAKFLRSTAVRDQVTCELPAGTLHLLMAKSMFADENGLPTTVLILRDLTRLKQLESQVQQRERMQVMGEVAAGLAHEIRNPLNAIGTIIQQLRKDFKPSEDTPAYDQLTGIVHGEVRRIDDAVHSFLRTVRPEPLKAELFDLQEFLVVLRTEYSAMLSEHGLSLNLVFKWSGDVQWDRRQMQQVFMNLVQNAIEAMSEGGALRITVQQPEEGWVEAEVSDDGTGMSADIQSRIFNLYFTTKADGTGIGLSMVQRIVQDHGGTIAIESAPAKGSTFTLRIPQWYTKRGEV